MNHIINNNQTRPNRLAMVRPTRQHFEFNNGYNRIRQPRPSFFNISNTSSDILVSNEILSSFQYNLFNTVIDISVNNLSIKESLEKGTEMSSKVIQQIGARL